MNLRYTKVFAPIPKLSARVCAQPSEGKGHTFESCRVRQIFLYFATRYVRGLKLQLCLVQVSKRLRWKIVAECRELCSEATQHNNRGAQRSHSIPHLHVWSRLIPRSG